MYMNLDVDFDFIIFHAGLSIQTGVFELTNRRAVPTGLDVEDCVLL